MAHKLEYAKLKVWLERTGAVDVASCDGYIIYAPTLPYLLMDDGRILRGRTPDKAMEIPNDALLVQSYNNMIAADKAIRKMEQQQEKKQTTARVAKPRESAKRERERFVFD